MTTPNLTPIEALRKFWGYESFRSHQLSAIEACIEGRDGLLVLHTSGGKSLCFQVPAVVLEGTAIVISPLISLMKDQVDALTKKGIPATFINSSLSAEEALLREDGLRNGRYKLVYCAPEKLDNPDFRDLIAQSNVSFIAIDESHCVSTWGHDFRLAYRRIPQYLDEIGSLRERRVPRFAYTATATPDIRLDIMNQLSLENPYHDVGSFDRPNIAFHVQSSSVKNKDVMDLISQHHNEPTIVYSATVKVTEELASRLKSNGISAAAYHGKLTAEEKDRVQNAFLADDIQVIVATNAFGMGVDKPDVRNVIHYHMPANVEAFYQEAGRAGRDGEKSNSYLLYSKRDRSLQEFLIDMSYPNPEYVWEVFYALMAYGSGTSFYLSEKQIAGICRSDIDTKYIGSILRILEDKKFIELDRDINTYAHTGISIVAEPDSDMDLEYLIERRKHVMSNLNSMEMLCQTTLCRRRFILKHFGEEQGYDACGFCDNCLSRGISASTDSLNLPAGTIKNVLHGISDIGSKLGSKMVTEALVGSHAQMLRRRGIHEKPYFSSLQSWTSRDVGALITWLVEMGYAQMQKKNASLDVVTMTNKSKKWVVEGCKTPIPAPPQLRHRALNTFESGINKRQVSGAVAECPTLDSSNTEKIKRARRIISSELGKPAFMVFSDKVMGVLASGAIESKKDLINAGIPHEKVDVFGDRLLELYKEKRIDADNPANTIPDIPF